VGKDIRISSLQESGPSSQLKLASAPNTAKIGDEWNEIQSSNSGASNDDSLARGEPSTFWCDGVSLDYSGEMLFCR
jgi:hypothetical protein